MRATERVNENGPEWCANTVPGPRHNQHEVLTMVTRNPTRPTPTTIGGR